MIIYPALDLRGGKIVRLREGDPSRQITFSDDPVTTARQWIAQGAQWLHMVNLDGALATANDNGTILKNVAGLGIPVQFGGGLRTLDDMALAFDQGAARIVLGTIALTHPELVEQAVQRWGADAVCVALDARNGRIATQGWQTQTDITPADLGRAMTARGVRHALFTDITRDGGLSGVNLDATIALAQQTHLQIIASGGVSSTADIERLRASQVIAGAVIGMALYEGRLTLTDALKAAGG
jgi:phosphoribosylformimino-5-aminoimidazole carboxamide ribotide isomerase